MKGGIIMAKTFDSKKSRQTLDNIRKSIDEKKQKLDELNASKQDLFEMRNTIDSLDMDENLKAKMDTLLVQAYENLKDQGKAQSVELDETIKEAEDTKSEIMDTETDTREAVESLSNKSGFLEKVGIHVFDEAKAEAEASLQELQDHREESIEDINEILKLSHEFNAI